MTTPATRPQSPHPARRAPTIMGDFASARDISTGEMAFPLVRRRPVPRTMALTVPPKDPNDMFRSWK